ncbi:MAG: M12 family metallopeptidase [Myxococcota bacterium]|nr:M12 family metallopeptidase [Myxococcota bacterium]
MVFVLILAGLAACDFPPELIGMGHFQGVSANPEDDLEKGEGQVISFDPGIIPVGAPFYTGPEVDTGLGRWDPGRDIPGYWTPDIVEEAFPGQKGEPATVMLRIGGSKEGIPVQVEVFDGEVVLEGDIRLGHIDDFRDAPGSRSAGLAESSTRWPGGVVPYDPTGVSAVLQARIATAISDWHADTAITFIVRTSETDYVRFVPGDGCSSALGMEGGPQEIELSNLCSTGNVRHELGHTVGLLHEHTRTDRDSFVSVDFGATDEDDNYERYVDLGILGVDLGPYDLQSIMHYGSFDFATDPSVPVMLTTDGAVIVRQRAALTEGDRWGVDRMYFDTWQVSWSGTSTWSTLNYSGLDPSQLLFGDFNGDGEDDIFWADGSKWRVSWSGTSAWDPINTSGYTDLKIGDLDGDGRDDVFLATGRAWYVSWAGTSGWDPINTSTYRNVKLGDVNGDGADDVFLADGSRWFFSSRGTSSWLFLNTSTYSGVQLADMNGDGTDDVFVATGSLWKVSWSGITDWEEINTSSYNQVRLADFDGDGIDDVFRANGSRWLVSWGGRSGWDELSTSGYTNLGIADFDGDGEADVMVQIGPYGI